MAEELDLGQIEWGSRIAETTSFVLAILGFTLPFLVAMAKVLALVCGSVRRAIQEFCIRAPLFRTICRPMALTQFCSSVALLMKAGVPYHESVAAAGPLSGFWPFERAATKAAELLEKGQPQSEAWQCIRLFPANLRFLTQCGAQRGEIPESFEELARLYETEALGRTRLMATVISPLCLLLLGAIALLMMGGMLWPYFSIIERLGR
jgi:type II secretory pathway component PulF